MNIHHLHTHIHIFIPTLLSIFHKIMSKTNMIPKYEQKDVVNIQSLIGYCCNCSVSAHCFILIEASIGFKPCCFSLLSCKQWYFLWQAAVCPFFLHLEPKVVTSTVHRMRWTLLSFERCPLTALCALCYDSWACYKVTLSCLLRKRRCLQHVLNAIVWKFQHLTPVQIFFISSKLHLLRKIFCKLFNMYI